jgi:hypothetical protein
LNTAILAVAIAGMAAGFGFFILEITRWRGGESFITRYHKALRVALFVLIEGLMALMLIGVTWPARDRLLDAIYWSGCVLVGIAVVIVAWLDLREVLQGTRRMVRSTFRGGDADKK